MDSLLFTGASGFLGKNILPTLIQKYEVTTLGNLPIDDIFVNLAKEIPSFSQHYDIVLHAAGKAHVVPKTPEEERSFYDINYEGTKNLCKALEKVGAPKSLIFISSVAVYGCESGELIDECHPRNGDTPYARSKIMTEDYLISWCKANGVILTILRPSIIAGSNPPGNLGDMIKGIKKGFYLNIAGGKAKKSILMADDISVLLELSKDKGGVYNVCDTDQHSYNELSILIANQLHKSKPISIPYWIAKILAVAGDCLGRKAPINTPRLNKLTRSLTFSNAKAISDLGWHPIKVTDNFKIH